MNARGDMGAAAASETTPREAILDPVDRVSEIMFGLLMAVSFTGALSVASAGQEDVRTMMAAALGCNLAWGLVDAVMYLVREHVARGHVLAKLRSIRAAADAATANARITAALPDGFARALTPPMIDALRRHVQTMPEPPPRPPFERRTLLAAGAVFALVVAATFPVVVPFMLIDDMRLALRTSNGVAVAMLFIAGLQLGRHAGIGGVRTGLWMVALGVVMVAAIMFFGG